MLVKDYIKENVNFKVAEYFYLDFTEREVETHGLVTKVDKGYDDITEVLDSLESLYFHFDNQTELNLYRLNDYSLPVDDIGNVFTYTFEPKTGFLYTQYVFIEAERHNFLPDGKILFIDLTKNGSFNFKNGKRTFKQVGYLDEFFQSPEVTRIYKFYNDFYFFQNEVQS